MVLAKKRVLLHTKDGRSIEGLLLRRKPEFALGLAELVHLVEGETTKNQVDGVVKVPRENVSFYQVL
jgi:hypothetical protein